MALHNTRFSIITVCLNPGESLQKCIASVDTQTFQDCEHIIVDGGSTDGTVELLKTIQSTRLKWVSEQDRGISNAMNKGIQLAQGEWLLFLHSDDWLSDEHSLERVNQTRSEFPAIISSPVKQHHPQQTSSIIPNLGWCIKTLFKTTLGHQGAFIHKDLFERLGEYNEDFQITMDYEWFLRAYDQKVPIVPMHTIVSEMSATGISSQTDWSSLEKRFAEEKEAHQLHSKSFLRKYLYQIYWTLYPTYRKIIYKSRKRSSD